MTRNTYRHGHFVWHELMTPNAEAAEKFYTDLLGWTFKHSDMGPGGIYRLIHAGERQLGGIMQMQPGQDHPAVWCGYISVPDVDSAAKSIDEKGGKVVFGPMDIPNVGRFATAIDPEGAMFVVFRDNKGDGTPEGMPKVGEFCWDTLGVHDGERALAFYSAVAGWQRGKFGDAPNLFLAAGDGQTIADVEAPPPGAPSHWMTHVVVPELNSARAKAESLGAKILAPEVVVPNVGKMAVIADPWGAVISLFEPGAQS